MKEDKIYLKEEKEIGYVYELIKKAKDGNKKAEEKLINNNINLVWAIVNRLNEDNYQRYEKEDLFQIGVIGLIKAIRKFETNRELKFSTYAFPLILGEIKMFMREDGIIKVSRIIKENAKKVLEIKERYIREGKGDITLDEISKELEIPLSDVILAMNYKNDICSLDADDDDNENVVRTRLKANENVEENVVNKTLMKEMMKKLNKLERKVIILRYLKEEKQIDVGKLLNITQVKVSRIEKEALIKLRRLLA